MTKDSSGTERKLQRTRKSKLQEKMTLNETTAMDVLKTPRNKSNIDAIKIQESQLRVFTEEMTKGELNQETYWNELQTTMKSRSEKKFDRVMQFSRFPLPVVQLSDSILNDFFKVFEGKNRYFNISGDRDTKRIEDWIKDHKPSKWIEEHAKMVFKNKPNSFVVIDIDESGNPYLIFVDSTRLIDAEFKNDEGELDYIAFIHSKKVHETKPNVITTFFAVYDESTYFVFSKDSDSDDFVKVSEQKKMVCCSPGRSFITTKSNSKNPFKRRVAFSNSLSKMEDWTIFDIFRNYVDHYAPFPITEAPKKRCPNDLCQNGSVAEQIVVDAAKDIHKTVWKKCDACGGSDTGDHIYPGTHIGINVQSDKNVNDGSGVFRMIFPDVDKLKYVPEKLDDIEVEVRLKTVGVNNLMNSEAVNELQVKGSFTSMESVLIRTKTELDQLYKWIVESTSKVFYQQMNIEVDANFGTEWYLVSEDDLQSRYLKGKEAGLPFEELQMIYIQLIETKYKGNPSKVERQKMLLQLDPLPLYSNKEAVEMRKENAIDDFDLSMKINFLNFITKFESENAPITQFGLALEPFKRLDIISETLILYNNEKIKSKQLPASE